MISQQYRCQLDRADIVSLLTCMCFITDFVSPKCDISITPWWRNRGQLMEERRSYGSQQSAWAVEAYGVISQRLFTKIIPRHCQGTSVVSFPWGASQMSSHPYRQTLILWLLYRRCWRKVTTPRLIMLTSHLKWLPYMEITLSVDCSNNAKGA